MKYLIVILSIFTSIGLQSQEDCIVLCKTLTTVDVGQSGVTVSADDILEITETDCLPYYQVQIETPVGGIVHPHNTSVNLTCADLGDLTARVSVIDNNEIFSTCTGTIKIEDSSSNCQTSVGSGMIPVSFNASHSGPYVQSVYLNGVALNKLPGNVFELPEVDVLVGQNEITFDAMSTGLAGVSSLDMVLIQRLIEEISTESEINTIAGDIDRSNYIGINDIFIIRKMILGIEQYNNSFHYLHPSEDFTGFNTFDFGQDVYTFTFDQSDLNSINFAFDVYQGGDVNQSINFRSENSSENRNGVDHLRFDNIQIDKGVWYEIPLTLISGEGIEALQFAFNNSNFETAEITSDYATNVIMTNNDREGLKVSFLPNEDTHQFECILSATFSQDGELKDLLKLTDVLDDEIVFESLNTAKIELASGVTSTENVSDHTSYRIYPNPFTNETVLELPKSENTTTIEVYDVHGRKCISEQTNAAQFVISKGQLNGTGTYLVKLVNGKRVSSHRLILVD